MPTKVGSQLVPESTVPLVERLDPAGRATIDAMFDRVVMDLGAFRRGDQIVGLLKRCLLEPIYATASSDMAWSTFIGRLNDELFEGRLLTEEDSLAFWQVLFRPETIPPVRWLPSVRH